MKRGLVQSVTKTMWTCQRPLKTNSGSVFSSTSVHALGDDDHGDLSQEPSPHMVPHVQCVWVQ